MLGCLIMIIITSSNSSTSASVVINIVQTSFFVGTIYWPHEPVLFQSIGNPFIFRCIDGMLIDGNDKGLSKLIYR